MKNLRPMALIAIRLYGVSFIVSAINSGLVKMQPYFGHDIPFIEISGQFVRFTGLSIILGLVVWVLASTIATLMTKDVESSSVTFSDSAMQKFAVTAVSTYMFFAGIIGMLIVLGTFIKSQYSPGEPVYFTSPMALTMILNFAQALLALLIMKKTAWFCGLFSDTNKTVGGKDT